MEHLNLTRQFYLRMCIIFLYLLTQPHAYTITFNLQIYFVPIIYFYINFSYLDYFIFSF